jgi:cytoskeletal protein CcmA (bactofilin family)
MPTPSLSPASIQDQVRLGESLIVHGELSGNEDLAIEGQFEGTINLQGHCLTVGADGQVKAEIHAGRVLIQRAVNGNITARDRLEIRKTGQVVGDLVSPGISIEDGAYFKGSIEILREGSVETAHALPSQVGDDHDDELSARPAGSLTERATPQAFSSSLEEFPSIPPLTLGPQFHLTDP